jgi:hypothetical protein
MVQNYQDVRGIQHAVAREPDTEVDLLLVIGATVTLVEAKH